MGSPASSRTAWANPWKLKDADDSPVSRPGLTGVRTYISTGVARWYGNDSPGKFSSESATGNCRRARPTRAHVDQWQCTGKSRSGRSVQHCVGRPFQLRQRRDAVYFTLQRRYSPSGAAELAAFTKCSGIPEACRPQKSFDFVVVGGGIAGMCRCRGFAPGLHRRAGQRPSGAGRKAQRFRNPGAPGRSHRTRSNGG